MANAKVQASSLVQASNATSVTVSLAGVTAGNLLVAVVAEISNSSASIAPSGATASSWKAVAPALPTQGTTSEAGLGIWYIENAPAGTASITVTGPTGWWNAQIIEYSGPATSGALRAGATIQLATPSTAGASTAACSAQSGDLVIAIIEAGTGATQTNNLVTPATPGYTDAANYKGATGAATWDHSYKTSAGASEQASWTYSAVFSNITATTAIASFAGSGAAPTGAVLAGSASAVSTGSGTLTSAAGAAAALASNAACSATASASLSTGISLQAAFLSRRAVATATGDLTTGISLQASTASNAAASAALTSAAAGLQSAAVSSSTLSANLGTAIICASNATASVAAAAALTSGISLVSGGVSTSLASANLSTGIALQSAPAVSVEATASVLTQVNMIGSCLTSASSTADIATGIPLAGDAMSADSASGLLTDYVVNPALVYREPSLTYVEYR